MVYENMNDFERGLRDFGTRVDVICAMEMAGRISEEDAYQEIKALCNCLLYTSPSPRDLSTSRMPSSA